MSKETTVQRRAYKHAWYLKNRERILKKNAAKCDVRCANCHRVATHNRRENCSG